MGTHTGTGTGGTVTSIDDAGIGTDSTDTVTDYTLALKMTVNTL